MRIAAVTMVRNEADIIEASIRHNLGFLDHLLVIDHHSDDGTAAIVRGLIGEGLPLTLVTDDDVAFRQGVRSTDGARWLFANQGADWVIPLDADELLKASSRARLEWGLAQAPAGAHLRLRLQTYVADSYADHSPFDVARFRRRLATETYGQMRIAICRAFLAAATQSVTDGNHFVIDTARPAHDPRYPALHADVAVIAHFPIRSARQVTNKTILGWLAHAATRHEGNGAFHWHELFDEIKATGVVAEARLHELAVNYGMPRASWRDAASVALVDDPLPAGAPARHANAAIMDALPLLMAYAERLARAASPSHS